jgi:hypothetical protein
MRTNLKSQKQISSSPEIEFRGEGPEKEIKKGFKETFGGDVVFKLIVVMCIPMRKFIQQYTLKQFPEFKIYFGNTI